MDLVPANVRALMTELEEETRAQEESGVPRALRLRSIRPEVGPFLLMLALASNAKTIVEVGTSGGYSTLWLGLAARHQGGRVYTYEIDPAKIARADDTFRRAGLTDVIEIREGDGGVGLAEVEGSDLVFLDAEKVDYLRFLEPAVRSLRPGGILVADNLLSHGGELVEFRAAALAHPMLSGTVVPVGGGELVATKL